MRKSFESQAKIMSDGEINKETKETEIKPEEFLNELSEILTAMEAERANFDPYIETMIRQEAKDLGIEISEDEMREIMDDQQKKFKKEAKDLKKKFFKNIAPYVLLILMAFSYWRCSGKEIPFAERHIAQAQMIEKGITDSQRRAYIPGVSEFLRKGIIPFGYEITEQIRNFPHAFFVSGKERFKRAGVTDADRVLFAEKREDAWRLFLGLPQKNNTFAISDYRPANSTEDKCYFKINNFFAGFKHFYLKDTDIIKLMIRLAEEIEQDRKKGGGLSAYDDEHGIMGAYKVSKGHDDNGCYVSYYDRYDLAVPSENLSIANIIGKPLEIYNRYYYNEDTFEPTSK